MRTRYLHCGLLLRRLLRLCCGAAVFLCVARTVVPLHAQADARVPVDCLMVCPADFLPAMQPWLVHRQNQGHTFAIITNPRSADSLRETIRDLASRHPLRYVLLVGDAPDSQAVSDDTSYTIAVASQPSTVGVRYGSEPTIATDNWYADLNDDDIPELAIGRWTADSTQQVQAMVQKTLHYEQSNDLGLWNRRVNFVAGVGGFGAVPDYLVETTAKKLITHGIPAEYQTQLTHASWRSPFAPDPRFFRQSVVHDFNDGCLAWIYMGHGNFDELDRFRVPQGEVPILHADDARQIACQQGAPIAAFLSCYAGAFDFPQDCLAEELLRNEQGPVAVIAGSRVTMPYAMAVLGQALMHEIFSERQPTVGEAFRRAKMTLGQQLPPVSLGTDAETNDVDTTTATTTAAAAEPQVVSPIATSDAREAGPTASAQATTRGLVDGLATLLSPHDLNRERREHLLLFNLLGDPLLRLHYPEQVTLNLPPQAVTGEALTIRGTCPVDGPCLVELVCRRDRQTLDVPRRSEFLATEAGLSAMTETWKRANDHRWNATTTQVANGRFEVVLTVPQHARGPSHVRIFVQGDDKVAMGAGDVYLRVAAAASSSLPAGSPTSLPNELPNERP